MQLLMAWTGLELRRRWRWLLVMALLVALSSTTVLAATAGARRGASALDRLLAQTDPATAIVVPNQPGFDWEAVRALPGVASVATFAVTSYRVGDLPPEAHAEGFPFDRAAMREVERPIVLEGRLADPGRADEAVVLPGFARTYGYRVGDVVDVRLYTPEQVEGVLGAETPPDPAGPVVPTAIVGIVQSPFFTDRGSVGGLQPSAGLLEQYPANLLGVSGSGFRNALVRLDDGGAGLPAFRSALAQVSGRPDIEMFDIPAETAKQQETLDFEAVSLLAFAAAALAAAAVLVGQAAARQAATAAGELQVLRAHGLRRRDAVVLATAPPVLAAVAGSAVGAGAALALSPLFPLGTAAVFEPDPGLSVDPLVLGAGGWLFPALVGVVTAVGARAALVAPRARRRPRRSALAAAAARAGLPVPVQIGCSYALEPGGAGRTALPVRPALAGAVTGVLGVVAAFTFAAAATDAADNPARFGRTHQIQMTAGQNGTDELPPLGPALAAIAADPDVTAVLDSRIGVVDAGTGPVTVFTHPGRPESLPTVLSAGRMPQEPDEIVLGPSVAAGLGVGVGSTLAVTGSRGAATLRVAGIGFVPYGEHNNYDNGAWLSPAGFDRLVDGFKFHDVYVGLRDGADADAAAARLAATGGQALGGPDLPLEVAPPLLESDQIRTVEQLPVVLGGFLTLLSVGAVGHALATTVRRRRRDLAVLRAIGMNRGQVRVVVLTQAVVLAAAGVLVGLPLGLAAGRSLWRVVADITPLQFQPPFALLAAAVVPGAVLVAAALAAWPGQQASRLRISETLRTE